MRAEGDKAKFEPEAKRKEAERKLVFAKKGARDSWVGIHPPRIRF
jgi:hypothetical protein